MIGKIKHFNGRFGFIIPEGKRAIDKNDNVFFHQSALPEGSIKLADGMEVEYELIPHYPDKKALFVQPLSKRSYAPVREFKKGAAYGTD
jgi:cold shock CspA family protein